MSGAGAYLGYAKKAIAAFVSGAGATFMESARHGDPLKVSIALAVGAGAVSAFGVFAVENGPHPKATYVGRHQQ